MDQDTINLTKIEYEELLSWKETCEILLNESTMNSIKASMKQYENGEEIPISEL